LLHRLRRPTLSQFFQKYWKNKWNNSGITEE
jgi:hypothetical protein